LAPTALAALLISAVSYEDIKGLSSVKGKRANVCAFTSFSFHSKHSHNILRLARRKMLRDVDFFPIQRHPSEGVA
jgi:hypothetical protein